MRARIPSSSEHDYQDAIVDLAHLHGYIVFHQRPALTSKGYRSTTEYDGEGFPDLILLGGCVLAVELKSERGAVTPLQDAWLQRFQIAGAETFVWRQGMHSLEMIEAILKNHSTRRRRR